MADDVQLSANIGVGVVAAADAILGVYYQRIKLIHGADGVNAGDVATANPLPTADYPVTAGGPSTLHAVAAASNNATSIKAAAGQLYAVRVFNNATYPVYVKFYNKATAPNPAADTPVLTVGVQAGTARDVVMPKGFPFATGIGMAIVKGIADNDNTSVLLSDCVADVEYK